MSKKSKLSLYRFVGILLLGVLVSRLFFLESFLESFLQDDKISNRTTYTYDNRASISGHNLYKSLEKDGNHDNPIPLLILIPELTTSENRAFGDITHDTWQQWLAEHDSNSNQTKLNILETKTHGGPGGGCGISLQLNFDIQKRQSPIPSSSSTTTKAFFKIAHANMSHHQAESHLREIKAYYLDRILQTNAVLPCAGYTLDSRQVADTDKWNMITENLKCEEAEAVKTANSVQGSMMLWLKDLGRTKKRQIVESAENNTLVDDKPNEFTSAMNYAFFHYFGACMKSDHNHFAKVLEKGDEREHIYVAIDNDRCMIPKSIYADSNVVPGRKMRRLSMWEDLVYKRICDIPHELFPVVGVIREAAKSKNTSTRISNRPWRRMFYQTNYLHRNPRHMKKSTNEFDNLLIT
eukprot:CAMPEP_0116132316 /NCGR_PEP_ID=MMETSP0329-20121206/9480_1 /TAXON_ID=697910 /ORGANISM="Pseudo-nitzschia arenysensis, Strain B593" /LENGTH=407 /DNA_ID=CAMNT_0003626817 /DNA_START=1 /DNA_END=1224 /DNA_ORIENTATION=-